MENNYTRRDFMKSAGCLTALALAGCTNSVGLFAKNRPAPNKPNILFIFTDDQRFDTIAALGNKEIITPNMDELVLNGTSFTNAYIAGSMSGAVCMPSRAMLMTGKWLFHLENKGRKIPLEHSMLGEVLQKSDYVTFGTGKWHNGRDSFARSFTTGGSIFFGGMHGMKGGGHLTPKVYDFDPTGEYPTSKQYKAKQFSSNLYSDAAVKFLAQHKGAQPFFMYISYTAPHDPRMAPKEFVDMYAAEKIQLPKNFMAEHPFDNGDLKLRDERLAPWPRTPGVVREHIIAYYAMITHLDAQIGRVLTVLKETGRDKNTIIVFAGDNGLAVGQHGLMGKQNLYDHSVRVPLIFTGPGIGKNKKCDALCYLNDIFPTLCDLTGQPIPDSVEGESLARLIQGKKKKVRDSVFFAYKSFQRGVRTDRWKLIYYNVKGKKTTQLFDMKNDPWEMTNLADDPTQAGRIKELTALMEDWFKKTGDKVKLQADDWAVSEISSWKPSKK